MRSGAPKAWGIRSIQPGLTNRDRQAPQEYTACRRAGLCVGVAVLSRLPVVSAVGYVATMRRVCVSALLVYRVFSGEDRRMRFCEFCSSAAIAEPCPASAGHGREGTAACWYRWRRTPLG